MIVRTSVRILVILAVAFESAWAASGPAKYRNGAVPLSVDRSFVQKTAAPDFWALIPHYVSQIHGRACSVAAIGMVVNAARAGRNLSASDELATQAALLEKITLHDWPLKSGAGSYPKTIVLTELADIAVKALETYGVAGATAEAIHVSEASAAARKRFRDALVANEKSARDLIFVNYIQGMATGDPEGNVGHLAPVAAYDAAKKRVLLLDPDRQWYEPYWAPEEKVFDAMNTLDKDSGKNRGYVWVKLKAVK
jgi:hypothetical protein